MQKQRLDEIVVSRYILFEPALDHVFKHQLYFLVGKVHDAEEEKTLQDTVSAALLST